MAVLGHDEYERSGVSRTKTLSMSFWHQLSPIYSYVVTWWCNWVSMSWLNTLLLMSSIQLQSIHALMEKCNEESRTSWDEKAVYVMRWSSFVALLFYLVPQNYGLYVTPICDVKHTSQICYCDAFEAVTVPPALYVRPLVLLNMMYSLCKWEANEWNVHANKKIYFIV